MACGRNSFGKRKSLKSLGYTGHVLRERRDSCGNSWCHSQGVSRDGQARVDGAAAWHEGSIDHIEILEVVRPAIAVQYADRGIIAEAAGAARMTVVHGEVGRYPRDAPRTHVPNDLAMQPICSTS